jgi:hypothetical protein
LSSPYGEAPHGVVRGGNQGYAKHQTSDTVNAENEKTEQRLRTCVYVIPEDRTVKIVRKNEKLLHKNALPAVEARFKNGEHLVCPTQR